MSDVIREDRDGVAMLTLNRPLARNALSPGVFLELRDYVDSLVEEFETVGCVILRGAGDCFSAGNDLKALERRERLPTTNFQSDTIAAMEELPQPVIASVQGYCMAGALELALACDLLVAGESALFSDNHGQWGLAPAWGMSQRLPRRIGALAAREMMYTGRKVTGPEAVTLGLANRCVPDVDLEQETLELALACVTNSWWSLRQQKRLTRASFELPLSEGLKRERDSEHFAPDAAERMRSFTRKPD